MDNELELNKVKEELQVARETITALRQSLSRGAAELNNLRREIDLSDNASLLKKESKSLKEYNDYLKDSLSEKDKEIKRLENELASVRNAHGHVLDNHSGLLSELCKEKSKSKTLTKEIKDYDAELNKCKTEINELRRNSERKTILQSFSVLLEVQEIINEHIDEVYGN